MKYYLFLIVIIAVSCKKTPTITNTPLLYDSVNNWGVVNFFLDNASIDTFGLLEKKLITKVAAHTDGFVYGLSIDRFSNNTPHYRRENIIFGNLHYPPIKGIYKLGGNYLNSKSSLDSVKNLAFSEYWLYLYEEDVLAGNYEIDGIKNSFIEINDYNEQTQELKGRFEVNYIIRFKGVMLRDTFKVSNGYFHTKIFKNQ